MIAKEIQDQVWAVLPKEFRERVKEYLGQRGWGMMASELLQRLFGSHNLTSDEEYPEMLMVEREKVMQLYDNSLRIYQENKDERSTIEYQHRGRLWALFSLFGSKCLPDELASEEAAPKFKVGDKVIHKHKNREVGEVTAYFPHEKFCYSVLFGKEYHCMTEEQLDPYTEPTETRNEAKESENTFASEPKTNEDMEEKELNLAEILRGHEGESFFDMIVGEVFLDTINNPVTGDIDFHTADGQVVSYTDPWMRFHKSGTAILYPSKESFYKYPLNCETAWMEWIEANKPKRWRAEKYEGYWFIEDCFHAIETHEFEINRDCERYKIGNYFRTVEEARQAAEAVRATLEQFHKEHQQ